MAPNNTLAIWGNEKTMNLNSLILTNIQSSPYFKVNLYELKTYHEVVDEVYYKVTHMEPWEKGSRKTAGQTGMCGGVRGVGAGGIVSSAYCLLYKLFTLRLTRKQVIGLLDHNDSPYIRGVGFMYLRYTQDPKELWDWFEPYLDDEEEVDVKAGGGHIMTIGEMARQLLTKLEWYSTLFPRIPVPVQKDLVIKFKAKNLQEAPPPPPVVEVRHIADDEVNFGEAEKYASHAATRKRSPTPPHRSRPPAPRRSPPSRRSPPRHRSPQRHSAPRHRPSPPRFRRSRSPQRRGGSPAARRGGSQSHRGGSPIDFARELQMERERQIREKDRHGNRSRSHSRERHQLKERKMSPPREKFRQRSKSKERHPHKHSSKSHDKHSKKKSRSQSRERHSGKHSSKEKKSKKHRSRSKSRERKKHKNKRKSRSLDRNGVPY